MPFPLFYHHYLAWYYSRNKEGGSGAKKGGEVTLNRAAAHCNHRQTNVMFLFRAEEIALKHITLTSQKRWLMSLCFAFYVNVPALRNDSY